MSFFKNIRKTMIIDVLGENHTFYALQASKLVSFTRIQKDLQENTSQEVVNELCAVLIEHYAATLKPTVADLLTLDCATLGHISKQIIEASTPLEYVADESESK